MPRVASGFQPISHGVLDWPAVEHLSDHWDYKHARYRPCFEFPVCACEDSDKAQARTCTRNSVPKGKGRATPGVDEAHNWRDRRFARHQSVKGRPCKPSGQERECCLRPAASTAEASLTAIKRQDLRRVRLAPGYETMAWLADGVRFQNVGSGGVVLFIVQLEEHQENTRRGWNLASWRRTRSRRGREYLCDDR